MPIGTTIVRSLAAALALAAAPGALPAQIPEKFENLKYFPKDIPRDTLIQIMRGYSIALGVRCQYCHVTQPLPASGGGGGGGPRERTIFHSDDKKEKRTARFMMHMTDSLNRVVLAALPERRNPPVRVSCVTCHHGSPFPQTLETVLAESIDRFGADSAIARYRRLREDMVSGRYDFSELSLSELSRALGERGKTAEAIAMLKLNQEFNPASPDIDFQIGELHLKRGERELAAARYQAVLGKRPNDMRARRRLQELGK